MAQPVEYPSLTFLVLGALAVAAGTGCDSTNPSPDPASVSATVSTAPTAKKPAVIQASVAPDRTMAIVAALSSKTQFGFIGVGLSEDRFRLFPFADQMVIMRGGHAYQFAEGKFERLKKAVTTQKGPNVTPVLGAYSVERLEGRWPDLLIAKSRYMTMGRGEVSDREETSLLVGGKWKKLKGLRPRARVVATSGGVMLQVATTGDLGIVAAKDSAAKAPTRSLATEGAACSKDAPLVRPSDVDVGHDGSIMTVGAHCDGQHLALERWAKAATKSSVITLPSLKKGTQVRVRASSAALAYVVVAGSDPTESKKIQVAVVTKDDAKEIALDLVGGVESAIATKDGALWLTVHRTRESHGHKALADRLVRISADGAVQPYEAPLGSGFSGVWARDKTTAYTVLNTTTPESFSYLFATADSEGSGAVMTLAKRDLTAFIEKKVKILNRPTATLYGDGCKHPFVSLYDVKAIVGEHFTFPATQRALKTFDKVSSLRLIDTQIKIRGQSTKRRLGVTVASAEDGRALIAHLAKAMPDEKPVLRCYPPESDARVIPIR